MPSPIDGGVVLVTGASSGIGRELARQIGPRAKALVLVARRLDRLEALAEELRAESPSLSVHLEPCDLGDRAGALSLFDAVTKRVGAVDVLVNNAGVGDIGVFDRADPARTAAMIELNVTSLVLLTRAFVAPMVERGRGAVLNVSSSFGLAFLSGFAAYIGTKHFVTGFTESLRADLSGTGVSASQLCPGPVATEFEEHLGNFTGQKPPALVEITAERCARAGISAIDRGRALVIPGLVMKLVMLSAAWTPRFVVRWIANAIGRALRRRQLAAEAAAAGGGGGGATSRP